MLYLFITLGVMKANNIETIYRQFSTCIREKLIFLLASGATFFSSALINLLKYNELPDYASITTSCYNFNYYNRYVSFNEKVNNMEKLGILFMGVILVNKFKDKK